MMTAAEASTLSNSLGSEKQKAVLRGIEDYILKEARDGKFTVIVRGEYFPGVENALVEAGYKVTWGSKDDFGGYTITWPKKNGVTE